MSTFGVRPSNVPRENVIDLPKFAAIDIGTNTVKMTIAARADDGRLIHLQDAGATPRLGEGIRHAALSDRAIDRTLHVLEQCVVLCATEGVQEVVAVGTSALRDALNRDEFVRRAKEIGLSVRVLSGDDEARLSALAVRSDPRWAGIQHIMVLDIGGGSTEVIFDDLSSSSQRRTSLSLGAVRLTEQILTSDPPTTDELRNAVSVVRAAFKTISWPDSRLTGVGVGGTITNMGAVALDHRGQPDLVELHGTALPLAEVQRQVALYSRLSQAERREIRALDPGRSDVILAGAIIVEGAMKASGLAEIAVSCRGLRWGVLYDCFGPLRGTAA